MSVSSDDESVYDFLEFDEDVLEMLKANRDIKSVSIWNNPIEHIDWGKEMNTFSNNTRLKNLEIKCWEEDVSSKRERRYAERNAKNFYRAVAANRSIESLSISGCLVRGLDMGEIFTTLTPLFRNNICSLDIGQITLESRIMQLLASALLNCNNLHSFGLNWCEGMNREVMETIVDILASNQNIESLSLSDYDLDEEAVVLGNALCNNATSVKKLYMSRDTGMGSQRGSISQNGMEALSESLSAQNSTLEILQLHSTRIGVEGGIILSDALTNNTVLKDLHLYMAVSSGLEERIMSSYGWNVFFNGLKNCSFRNLSLGGNTIGNEDIEALVDALNTMTSLKDLNLRDTEITSSGWVEFFNLMRRPGSVFGRLTHLNIMTLMSGPILDKEGVNAFAKALVNSSLQKLNLGTLGMRVFIGDDVEGAWDALSNALCDRSSIESIRNSNHTLEAELRFTGRPIFFGGESEAEEEYDARAPDEYTRIICPLLQLNKGTDKAEVIRQKLFRYYFSERSNLHELLNIKAEVLPHLLEAIGKEGAQFNLIYRIVQGMPSLFNAKFKVAGGKRKREDLA